MTNWIYDKNTQKEQALRNAEYTLFETLGDVNGYGWAKVGEEWSAWITKFSSREQATDYAYRKVIELGQTI